MVDFVRVCIAHSICIFFFKETATTEIYTFLHTLSLHDALPICALGDQRFHLVLRDRLAARAGEPEGAEHRLGRNPQQPDRGGGNARQPVRSEEHTSELQSLMRTSYAVFFLKKKTKKITLTSTTYQQT